jgi:hypothetical protein
MWQLAVLCPQCDTRACFALLAGGYHTGLPEHALQAAANLHRSRPLRHRRWVPAGGALCHSLPLLAQDAWTGASVSGPKTVHVVSAMAQILMWHRKGDLTILADSAPTRNVDEQDRSDLTLEAHR